MTGKLLEIINVMNSELHNQGIQGFMLAYVKQLMKTKTRKCVIIITSKH